MAYGLKYYKELTQPNGKVVRLEILEKGYEGASKEIGPVCQALRLDIQGDTEIDAPIVKTSLSMTFVDAPDHADARTKKCGNWDEFYTSDATLWRVVLKARNAQETAFATMWGGYITPDSYTEVLQYRGSVTLVARDNIGHLSDFPFDAEGNADGMISLIELIRGAWDKIESPMTLDDQAVANADWMLSDGVYAYDTYMNVSAFEDMNWYDALESALYAYGLVLRYTGNNNVSFYSLRNLPRMGAHEVEDISFIEPTFMSGAERELTPAVKRIEEAVDYEIVEQKAAPLIESVTFTGASSTIPFESKNIFGEKEWKNIPTWPIDNTTNEGWGNDKSKTLFYSPKAYGYDSVVGGNELYLATNTDGSGSVWYGLHMQGKSFKFTLAFGQLIERVNVPLYLSPIIVKKVDVIVSASANGVTSYLNAGGSWQTSEAVLNLSIDEETSAVTKVVPLGAFSLDETLVKVTIKNVSLGARAGEEWWDVSRGNGIYVAINALTFADNNGEALCETNRVNTNYDAKNNIILSRDPKIAPALNDVLFPSIIKNGIFVKEGRTYNPAKTWYWGGQTPQQMAVYNHLQLLCYHAKPNNILRGTIVNADVTDMQVIWMWHGAEHMLVSGTLDLISGYIENAVLREFARYEDMWGMLEPADMPEVEGKSSTNVEGGVAASNEGARMTSTTTVNIGGGGGSIVLDTFMSDTSQNGVQNRVIKAYVDGLGDDITEAYNAAISALNSEITNALSGKVDNATFNPLSTQVATNKTDIATNKTNIGKLDTRLTTAEGEIDTLQTYTTWLDSVKGLIYKEGDNIKINTSLIVVGDTSSGGSGQDTPASGTVTGIKVSASETLTPNNAGIIDMVSVLSSIDVSDQLTAYAKTEDVNAALLTKQDTISDLATIRSGAALGATALQSITKTMVTDALGYTPLSTGGGTISGDLSLNKYLRINAWSGYGSGSANISYDGTIKQLKCGDVANISLQSGEVVYHTGNFNPADYLPKSGGTMKDAATIKWGNNKCSWDGAPEGFIGMSILREDAAYGYYAGLSFKGYYGFQIRNYAGTDTYEVRGHDSNTWETWRTLIHSGNIGSQSVAEAQRLVSPYSYPNYVITNATTADSLFSAGYSFSAMQEDHPLFGYATIWNFSAYLKYGATQLAAHYNALTPRLALRNYNQDRANWSEWRELAFLDDNVASAQALTHSNGTVGVKVTSAGALQDKDGYQVFGCGLVYGQTFTRYQVFGSPSSAVAAVLEGGGAVSLKTNNIDRLFINSSGNVTIGGSDLAGTNWKMYVNGKAIYRDAILADRYNGQGNTAGASIVINKGDDYFGMGPSARNVSNLSFGLTSDTSGTWKSELLTIVQNGNVGIGTTSPEYKLDVAGTFNSNALRTDSTAKAFWGNTDYYGILSWDTTYASVMAKSGLALRLGVGVTPYITIASNGAISIAGAVTMSSNLSVGGHLALTTGFDLNGVNMLLLSSETATYGSIWYNNVFRGASHTFNGAVTMSSTLSVGGDGSFAAGLNCLDFAVNRNAYIPNIEWKKMCGIRPNSGANALIGYFENAPIFLSQNGNFRLGKYDFDSNAWCQFTFNSSTKNLTIGPADNFAFTTTIDGNLVVSGDTSSGSDIRFKDIIKNKTIKIEHIAKAPLFTFKWNDREDDTIHLGSSAQYWEKVTPWLVKGEDFKTLDYSTLGVAMGISLAKKAVNHEERIKVLEKENKALKEEIRRMQYGS